jgi:SAM-dependent methyltransferase
MDYSTYDRPRYLPTKDESASLGRGMLRSISRYFDSTNHAQSVLEIGCASGPLLHSLAMHGFKSTTGIDLSPHLVEHGRSTMGLALQQSDWLTYVQTTEARFDVIIALDVLEHIEPAVVEETLKATRGRLSDTGSLILRMPNADCPMVNPTFYGDITHRFLATPRLLMHLLRNAGFHGEIAFGETVPDHPFKRLLYLCAHTLVVKPLVRLFYYHFYGYAPKVVTRNMYCHAKCS